MTSVLGFGPFQLEVDSFVPNIEQLLLYFDFGISINAVGFATINYG
jgi:hypothetical protein